MATPFVSGVAALIKSKNLSYDSAGYPSHFGLYEIDLGDIGRDKTYGFGLVQAG
jgi:hypothetical protein